MVARDAGKAQGAFAMITVSSPLFAHALSLVSNALTSNALISSFGSKLSKQDCNDIIAECGFSETVRGEELDISAFSKIADSIFDRII